jgi:diguanylate cyclase (GGDEF)-like protein
MPTETQLLVTSLLVVLLIAVAGLFVLRLRRDSRRWRDLDTAMRHIAAGDYESELPAAEPGVTGRLSYSLGAMRDEIQEREAALHHLAFYDDMTGLPNRNQFRIDLVDRLEEARQEGSRVAVAMMDFDRFKEINDSLGHYLGDRLLAAIADLLEDAASRMKIGVARLGGDEFGLLISVDSINEAREQVETLREILGGALEIDDLRIDIETNVGLTMFPDQGGDAETLLQQAEVAMYVAKERRLGLTFYETSQNRHSIQRLGLMSDLRKAVENDGLELRFQPKLHLETGAVDQAEVLLRWTHPYLGEISPEEFIPIAEQTGFIREITEWVLRKSLEQVGAWQAQGLEVSAAVNVSAFDLHDRHLPMRVRRILEATGVAPDHLVLEITESTVMADLESGQRVLDALDRLGVTISIDDFGTGYSSLAQLKRLPVRELKIDRSFISQMTTAQDVAQIVRSTIELGHNLGLRVVAEGVESQEAAESLRLMRCDLAQGFYISKPLTAEELVAWRRRVRSSRASG